MAIGTATAIALGLAAAGSAALGEANKQGVPGSPKPRSVGNEGQSTLDAYGQLGPQQLAYERSMLPGYAGLRGNVLGDYLTGAGGVQDLSGRTASAQRGADIGDFYGLGPQYAEAFQRYDPQSYAAINDLLGEASADLRRPVPQSFLNDARDNYRTAASSRGLAHGPGAAFNEALSVSGAGQAYRQQARGNVMGALGAKQSIYGQPFQNILSQRSQAFLPAMYMSPGFGPSQFSDPYTSYAADVYGSNYNQGWAARNSALNNNAAITGGEIGALGALAEGAMVLIG